MGRITSLDQLDYAEDVTSFGSPVIIFVGPPSTGTSAGAGGADGADGAGEALEAYWRGVGFPNIYIQYDLLPNGSYSIPSHFKIFNYTIVEPYCGGVGTYNFTTEDLGLPLTSAKPEIVLDSFSVFEKIFYLFNRFYIDPDDTQKNLLPDKYQRVFPEIFNINNTTIPVHSVDNTGSVGYFDSWTWNDLDSPRPMVRDLKNELVAYPEPLPEIYPTTSFSITKLVDDEIIGYIPYSTEPSFLYNKPGTLYKQLKNTVTVTLPKDLCSTFIPDFEVPVPLTLDYFVYDVSVSEFSTNAFPYAFKDLNDSDNIIDVIIPFSFIKEILFSGALVLPNNLIIDNNKICTANKLPVFPVYPKYPRGVKNIKFQKAAIYVAHFDDELILFQPLCELVPFIRVCMYPFNDNYNQIKSQVSYGSKVESIWSEITSEKYTQPTITGIFDTSNIAERDEYFFGNDRLYNQIKSSILELKNQGIDTIITHSPWGDYGHTHHMWIFSYIHQIAIENKLNVWCINKFMNGVEWSEYVIHSRAICVSPSYEFDPELTYSNAEVFHSIPIEGSTFDSWTWNDLDWSYTVPFTNHILDDSDPNNIIYTNQWYDFIKATLHRNIFPAGVTYKFSQMPDDFPPCLMMICGNFDNSYQNILDTTHENYIYFKEQITEMIQTMNFIGGFQLPPIVKSLIEVSDFFVPATACSLLVTFNQFEETDQTSTVIITGTDLNITEEVNFGLSWTYEWLIENNQDKIINLNDVVLNQTNITFTVTKEEAQYVSINLTRTARHPILDICTAKTVVLISPINI